MNYYPRFPGDYMRKTMHLSMVEDGAYTRLLDWYYANDKPIPHARRYAVARATGAAERQAVDAVLGEFFRLVEGCHHNDRADAEIESAAKRIGTARENGKKGGRKPANNPPGNPAGSVPANPEGNRNESSLTPTPKEEKEANASSSTAEPLPACPHLKLLALFADRLPTLPQPRAELWDGAKADALRARWKWLLTAKRADGRRYAATEVEGLEWFRNFFDAVSDSDFLMARRGDFKCSLGWLVKAENFSKVVDGNYTNGGKA